MVDIFAILSVLIVGTFASYLNWRWFWKKKPHDQKQWYLKGAGRSLPAIFISKQIDPANKYGIFTFKLPPGYSNQKLGADLEEIEIELCDINRNAYKIENGRAVKVECEKIYKLGVPDSSVFNTRGRFQIYLPMNTDNNFIQTLRYMDANSEVMINGPHGNHKYLDRRTFYSKRHDKTTTYKRLLIICEEYGYAHVKKVLNNELSCLQDGQEALEFSIQYLVDNLNFVMDYEKCIWYDYSDVGKSRVIFTNPNAILPAPPKLQSRYDENEQIKTEESYKNLFKKGSLTLDEIADISPLANDDVIVLVAVNNGTDKKLMGYLEELGFQKDQIIRFVSWFGN